MVNDFMTKRPGVLCQPCELVRLPGPEVAERMQRPAHRPLAATRRLSERGMRKVVNPGGPVTEVEGVTVDSRDVHADGRVVVDGTQNRAKGRIPGIEHPEENNESQSSQEYRDQRCQVCARGDCPGHRSPYAPTPTSRVQTASIAPNTPGSPI